MNKHLIVMCGPAGAGKSTFSKKYTEEGYSYINQDLQGRQHLDLFEIAIKENKNVIVDRMGFTKQQRSRYLDLAKQNGYSTEIIVLHQPYSICLSRCLKRQGHETIKDEQAARSALNMFFSKYERPTLDEADKVSFIYPDILRPQAVYCDLDGTLCEVEHRRHHIRNGQRKDWKSFFEGMKDDTVNVPIREILRKFSPTHRIVLCSGRPDNYRKETEEWLNKHSITYDQLFMRLRNDSRQDSITKEVLLDFEILTRYNVSFCLDDRDQVVQMLRGRGLTVLQVAPGDF